MSKKRVVTIKLSHGQYQTISEKGDPIKVATDILKKAIRSIELQKTEPYDEAQPET